MTTNEMEDILARLGIEVTGTRGNEVQARCPGHLELTGKEDRNPSWSINADTGAHICFSCGFKGGLQFLVNYVGGAELDTQEWLEDSSNHLRLAFNSLLKNMNPEPEKIDYLEESMLAIYTAPPAEALKSRGISSMAAEHYEILWDPRHDSWIIPIRDPRNNKLLGWQEKGNNSRFFKNQPTGVKKSRALFGYGQYSGGYMILVESPLDVARLASVGQLGGVAAYGALVSKEQLTLIQSADRLIIAMDNDDAGRKSSGQLFDWAKSISLGVWFFDYTGVDVKDVGGMSKSEIDAGIANAKYSLRGKSVVYG